MAIVAKNPGITWSRATAELAVHAQVAYDTALRDLNVLIEAGYLAEDPLTATLTVKEALK